MSEEKPMYETDRPITPLGYPVIIHAQVGDFYELVCGLVTDLGSGYSMDRRYIGRVSVVAVTQADRFELIRDIEHHSQRISASFWLYPDEIDVAFQYFATYWNAGMKHYRLRVLAKMLGLQVAAQAVTHE